MKRIFTLLILALFVLISAVGTTSAKGEQTQISITDVEKLIDQKMVGEKSLTEEELTRALLEMKDEKISDLDSNVSKTIDLFSGFLAIAAFILAALTGIIGWFFKRNVDDKLAKIEAKEENINQKHAVILAKAASIEEYYREIKQFRDDRQKFNLKLNDISKETEELKINFKGLGEYVQTIEEITDSSVVMIQFLNQRNDAEHIVREVKEMIQQPQKHLPSTLSRLTKKLGGDPIFSNMQDVEEHLEYLTDSLAQEEINVCEKIETYRGAVIEHYERDGDTMDYYEEISSVYEDWKGYLEVIKAVNEVWKAQLGLNPVNPLSDTEPNNVEE